MNDKALSPLQEEVLELMQMDDLGEGCWTSASTLAEQCSPVKGFPVSAKQVRLVQKQLVKKGELTYKGVVIHDNGRRTRCYGTGVEVEIVKDFTKPVDKDEEEIVNYFTKGTKEVSNQASKQSSKKSSNQASNQSNNQTNRYNIRPVFGRNQLVECFDYIKSKNPGLEIVDFQDEDGNLDYDIFKDLEDKYEYDTFPF